MPNFDTTPYTQLTTPARNDMQGVVKDVSEALPENQTKYALLEDLLKFGSWASKVRTVTASGTVTLADTDPIFIEIDPDGADRDVSFPAKGDDNHGYYIRNVGSANVLTLKRSGGAEITTLEAGEAKYIMPSTISDFASLAGSSSSSSGIGGLTIASAAVTGSNVTGVEGTLHNLDLSGLTANRDFNLPTPSAADKLCGVRVSTGDATYALLVKVNSTEVTRLFITNEILVFQSTGTGAGDWVLTQNGTIGCLAVLERTTAQSIASSSTTQKVQFNSAPVDQGGMADVATNYRVNIRRTGSYEVSAYASLPGVDDTENMQARIYIDGAFVDYGVTYSPSADKALCSQVVKKYALTAGQYVEMYIFHTEGASQNTDTTYKPQLSVEETNGTGGTSGGGGGGDALTSNPLSQFAATTSSQLAGVISDETGSGALVFAESPTLVTPALGTPSALVLTNATGLPTAGLVDDAVTLAKFVNATAQYKLLGRLSASAGDFEEISGSANVFSFLQAADYAAMRTLLGLVIGTNVQAYDEDLDTWAAKTAPSGTVIGTTDTQTLTNKRLTPRVGTVSSSATPTINTDNYDVFTITALAVDITSMTTNLSGTPTDGQKLLIAITGTAARAITWGASFEASTIALPTTTVSTNRLDVGFIWNAATSKWRCIGYV